jgi:hypothetical protein
VSRLERATLLDEGNAVFLAPRKVGSSVHWEVEVEQATRKDGTKAKPTFNASVTLRDCGESITWSGYGGEKGPEHMIEKLNVAIDELEKMRNLCRLARAIIADNPGTDSKDGSPEAVSLDDL